MEFRDSRIGSIKFSDNAKDPGMVRDAEVKSVTLPAKAVKSGSFINCTSLRRVAMGNKVKTIESFKGCSALARLNLPSSVKTIEEGAFQGCTSLELYVPSSVKKIGKNAFGSKKSDRIKMLYCVKNSAAHKEAKTRGIPYTLVGKKGNTGKLEKITVTQGKYTLLKNEQIYLNVKTVPISATALDLTYKSSNPKAISVDDYGKVTALQYNSKEVITIQSSSNKTIRAKVTVEVKKKGSESFTLKVNGKKYVADLNEGLSDSSIPFRLKNVKAFRVYETDDPYSGIKRWRLVKETTKNKLSIKTKKKKYYRIEYCTRISPEYWRILCGETEKM